MASLQDGAVAFCASLIIKIESVLKNQDTHEPLPICSMGLLVVMSTTSHVGRMVRRCGGSGPTYSKRVTGIAPVSILVAGRVL